MPRSIKEIPDICGKERLLVEIKKRREFIYAPISNIDFRKVESSFGIALHMHQPTIPASTPDLRTAKLISNLQYMMEHQEIHDNHNAPVFMWCYSRLSDFIREMVKHGQNPRVMLDYSGNLLWGLEEMEHGKTIEKLKLITSNEKYYPYVEWLGTMWSHAVVTSTPVPDIKLHITAWQHHFSSIFGEKALERVKGFSAPEMHLTVHPDVLYEYIKALKDSGYEWLMVQEHTIENIDGSPITMHNFPHRLIAKNSLGKTQEITALIKTQGSDTKLIGQMQPYYEAKERRKQEFCGKSIPAYIVQISDGENGGVMMNEFPSAYKKAFGEIGKEGVVALNGSEYIEFVKKSGIKEEDFISVQPISQHKVWENIDSFTAGAADRAIEKAKQKDGRFNLERASWTNDRNWVKGYEHVLDPINQLSVEFHRKFDRIDCGEKDVKYKKALLYLLLSQTSCFRYWGSGLWTDYAKEICRRGMEALK